MRGEVMSALFEEFIDERLLLKAAEDQGVQVGEEEVGRELEKLAPLEREMTGERESLSRKVESRLKVWHLVEREVLSGLEVTDEEVRSHYDRHRDRYHGEATITLSQLLLENETEAQTIRQELVRSPDRFQLKAKELSVGPEAPRGGALGSFRKGELPPAFEEAVEGLEPGEISQVIQTDFGYHIFRLEGKTPAEPLQFEEVADAIRVELLRQKSSDAMSHYLEGLRQRYPVRVHRDRLSFPFTQGEQPPPGRS